MRKIIRRLQGQRSAFSGQRSDCTLNAIRCPLKLIFFLMLFCTLSAVRCPLSHANNISVSSVTTGAQDTGNDTLEIQFNLSWENSWRDATNYDAAWVFVKYSTDSGVTWNHAYLSATAGDHTMPAGYECKVGTTDVSGSKGVGVFIQRSSTGSGTASLSGVKLIWNYAENTNDVVTDDEAAHPITTQIRVMAIEMVHIPEGTFSAGSGGAESSCFTKTMIDTANATTAPSGSPLAGGYPSDQTVPNNASWPNGFGAFYLMKYDASQGQWVDFFNTLTADQKTTRDITAASGKNSDNEVNRNTISWTSGDASAGANQYVGCNYLNWADVTAYADWAGLRPMTELEYEKAARGTATAVANEYAWGSTDYTQVTGITDSGAANETATNSGNFIFGSHASVQGPMRCGFAATSNTTRAQAGASYYGVMELSGNLWKRPVTIGNSTGRAFTGLHGDGTLDASGDANVTNWPGTNADGSGFRGGSWFNVATSARGSDRSSAALTSADRYNSLGGRLARTSP